MGRRAGQGVGVAERTRTDPLTVRLRADDKVLAMASARAVNRRRGLATNHADPLVVLRCLPASTEQDRRAELQESFGHPKTGFLCGRIEHGLSEPRRNRYRYESGICTKAPHIVLYYT